MIPLSEKVEEQIGSQLDTKDKEEMVKLIQKNINAFAEHTNPLEGISQQIIEHQLDINPKAKAVKQKIR